LLLKAIIGIIELMPKETRTYKDRAEYFKMAVARRRRRIKQLAVEYKGNKCFFCGYSNYIGALDFHHINPNEKNFGLSVRGLTRSWKKVKQELDKCILVCANCHRELHAGIKKIPRKSILIEKD
jgi:5-methylcytosine-specific restriction endonuclease McrA